MRILIFGAGVYGRKYLKHLQNTSNTNVAAIVDNNQNIIGTCIENIKIIHPDKIMNYQYDKIVIATKSDFADKISKQLKDLGIPISKIEIIDQCADEFGYDMDTNGRVRWLRDFARNQIYKNNISGNVAECGVHLGHFARYINEYFPDRNLYLFDTFDGFSSEDLSTELSFKNDSFNNSKFALRKSIFKNGSIERVMKHMPNPEMCIVKKGYFPNTAEGIEDIFSFVNLDMDLYVPMLSALNFFWNKMVCGGVVLLHDYYHPELPGVAKAVADFESSINKRICKTPIGDFCSIALIKD